MSLILQGSTSGSITLQEPAVAGTTVLDLPATSGTILTTASQSIPSAALPAGSVLQVVQTVLQTSTTTTSTSYVTTNLSATITPKFSTSKIWVSIAANGVRTDNTTYNVNLALFRGASQQGNQFTWYGGSSPGTKDGRIGTVCFQLLDSPATTSSTSYTVYMKARDATSSMKSCHNGSTGTIILMEIAA